MNKLLVLFAFIASIGCDTKHATGHEDHQMHQAPADQTGEAKKPLSPRVMSMASIGDNHVHIDYGSPSKRGRVIFGGLVGYDNVWATGAHKATNISFQKDIQISDQVIPAGKYGLFTIPGADEWIIIINSVWDMHLADNYNQANDLIRITTKPTILDSPVESLTFEVISANSDGGSVTLSWDNVKVGFDFKNK